ncbi:MAG: signal peptidase I [Candidatus Dependentiae bacterium]|nr:signal peptidase I [Candidatus Dependentiae bacterium]
MFKRMNAWLDRQHMVVQILVLVIFVFLVRTYFIGFYLVPSGSMETTMLVGERFFADKLTPYFRDFQRGEVIAFNEPLYKYSSNSLVRVWQMYVWGPSNWTKRIIGLPGEHIKGVIEDGKPVVYVNEKKLDEPYINKYPLILMWKHASTEKDPWGSGRVELRSFDQDDYNKFYTIDRAHVARAADGQPYILKPGTPQPELDVFDVKLGPDEFWVMGDNRLGSDDSRKWGPLKRGLIHGRIKFRIFSIESTQGWMLLDLLLHPIDFWKRVRWGRCIQSIA